MSDVVISRRCKDVRGGTLSASSHGHEISQSNEKIATTSIGNQIFPHVRFPVLFLAISVNSGSGRKYSTLLVPILSISAPGPLLNSSLLALSLSRFGKVKKDYTAYQRGQMHYMSALRQLQAALDDPRRNKSDETLPLPQSLVSSR